MKSDGKTEGKTFRCAGCGDVFSYARRRPKYCAECGKIKLYSQIQAYKRRVKGVNKGTKEEHFGRKSGFIEMVGGASHEEIGRALRMRPHSVLRLERQVLTKLRANPTLKPLWDSLREEMAEGAQLDGLMMVRPADKGNRMLDYQQAIADWWRIHDDIKARGCTAEAEELMTEITKFQRKIAETICLT